MLSILSFSFFFEIWKKKSQICRFHPFFGGGGGGIEKWIRKLSVSITFCYFSKFEKCNPSNVIFIFLKLVLSRVVLNFLTIKIDTELEDVIFHFFISWISMNGPKIHGLSILSADSVSVHAWHACKYFFRKINDPKINGLWFRFSRSGRTLSMDEVQPTVTKEGL